MLRTTCIIVLVWVPILGAAEWGARMWVAAHGDALSMTRAVVLADPVIGWKQRAGLDTTFMHHPLRTNEWGWRDRTQPFDGEGSRALLLGPSSTFGWGVAERDTYARQLETMLEGEWRAINAGEIGYSVVQGRKLFSEIVARGAQPDVIVIAYGVNDLDYHRFYYDSARTDAEEFAAPHSAVSARLTNMLLASALVDLSFKMSSSFVPRAADMDRKSVRVPSDEFRAELTKLAQDAAAVAHVILLTTSVFVPENASPDARAEMERIEQGVAEYNDIVRSVGATSGVAVVDLDAVFAESVRAELFVDPIHFSARGNELVARAIAPILSSYASGREE